MSAAADAESLNEQQAIVPDPLAETQSQGLQPANAAAGESDSDAGDKFQEEGDEEEQSRRNAQPGALARIMNR